MKQTPWIPFAWTAVILAGLSGCATFPLDQTLQQQANKELNLAAVMDDPGKYSGTLVIWGGRLVAIHNSQEESELVIVEMPLDSSGRPKNLLESEGRFIARTPEFLDPEIFQTGRYLTLAGEITGQKAQPVGQNTPAFPVVTIRQAYLWNTMVDYYYPYDRYPYYDYWPYYPNWGLNLFMNFPEGRQFKHQDGSKYRDHYDRRRHNRGRQ